MEYATEQELQSNVVHPLFRGSEHFWSQFQYGKDCCVLVLLVFAAMQLRQTNVAAKVKTKL